MSDLHLHLDLASRKLISRDGGSAILPPFVLGDQLRVTVRTWDRTETNELRERDLRLRTLHAAIGRVMQPPTSGSFRLRIGTFESEDIPYDASGDALWLALSASELVESVESPTASTWLARTIHRDYEVPATIDVIANQLSPASFVRLRFFPRSGHWWFECRLIQTPLAFNDAHERVLPPPPKIRRVREGDPGTSAIPPSNEIQSLHLPSNFRGTYFLIWNFRRSSVLGIDDGPSEIASALDELFVPESGDAARFEVTNPEPDQAYIEFIGDLGGTPQPLITVEVNSFSPGTLTFYLPLDRAELAAALRDAAEIEVPFELEAEIVDDDADLEDPAIPGRTLTLFQTPVKVVREQIWEALATQQSIDWLHPAQARDYVPFTRDQIITGSQHYVCVFGDDESRSFAFPHHLGTDAVHVCVRENASGGRLLALGAEYAVVLPSANEAILSMPESATPPAWNSLAITISSAGPASAFLAHTHRMEQIIGLGDALSELSARVDAIERLLPKPNLLVRQAARESQEIVIPDRIELYPNARLPAGFDPKAAADGKTPLPRPPGLLPAVHDATVLPLQTPLLPASTLWGEVFQNQTAGSILIPGGLGQRGSSLPVSGYAASDGRAWFRVIRAGTSHSFFPADFERELFRLHINASMWRPGGSFSVQFQIELQLLAANTAAQMVLVIEIGRAISQADPAPVAENLENVQWQPEPVLSQRIIITSIRQKHAFGAAVSRSLDDVLNTEKRLYGTWQAASNGPTQADFLLRARLMQFDTENNAKNARGFVFYAMTQAKAKIA